jgi:hypothetical protein
MTATAENNGMVLTDIPAEDADGPAGAIWIAVDETERLRAMLSLAEDLDDDLRIDVLAFTVALFVGAPQRRPNEPGGQLGIGRDRLPSTTFELVSP